MVLETMTKSDPPGVTQVTGDEIVEFLVGVVKRHQVGIGALAELMPPEPTQDEQAKWAAVTQSLVDTSTMVGVLLKIVQEVEQTQQQHSRIIRPN